MKSKRLIKDGTVKPFEVGCKVVYIPNHLLMTASGIGKKSIIKTKNLGVVTSRNHRYVFVRYLNNTGSEATSPGDLYTLEHRPDLIKILKSNEKQAIKAQSDQSTP